VNSVTTTYTLDLHSGLTQVLEVGTNNYLYGYGRIGEEQANGFVLHLGDALGSVRQPSGMGRGEKHRRSPHLKFPPRPILQGLLPCHQEVRVIQRRASQW
jgi:hypothetical protein